MTEERRGDFEIVLDGRRFNLADLDEKTFDAVVEAIKAISDFFVKIDEPEAASD